MREDDRDLVALFAAEDEVEPDAVFVARVAHDVARLGRRRVVLMSAGGLALGLGGAAALALTAPLIADAGRLLGEAVATPQATWVALGAGLLLAIGAPLLGRR